MDVRRIYAKKVDDYLNNTKELNIVGGAIASGSFQAFDQEYLINALQLLGDNFFGVANIPVGMAESELQRLNNANVVAVRFNVNRGGSEKLEHVEKMSNVLF